MTALLSRLSHTNLELWWFPCFAAGLQIAVPDLTSHTQLSSGGQSTWLSKLPMQTLCMSDSLAARGCCSQCGNVRTSCNSVTYSRTYCKSLYHLFFICPVLILQTAAAQTEYVAVTTISLLPLLCTSCCHVWVLTRAWNKWSRSRCVEHRCRLEPVCQCARVSVNTMFWSCSSRH